MSENAIMNATASAISFKSAKLNTITAEITGYVLEAQNTANRNSIAISKALATVAKEELYKEDGFDSALDYAMRTFGWKRANAYRMIQVGTRLNAGTLPDGNFSYTQYGEMLALPEDTAKDAVEKGIITESMTAAEIREEVAELKPKKERKAKEEKVYIWLLDGLEHHGTVTNTESNIADWPGVDWTQRIKVKSGETDILGYLVCIAGEIRFYVRGAEVVESTEEKKEA